MAYEPGGINDELKISKRDFFNPHLKIFYEIFKYSDII
jgi:hypothetical protein